MSFDASYRDRNPSVTNYASKDSKFFLVYEGPNFLGVKKSEEDLLNLMNLEEDYFYETFELPELLSNTKKLVVNFPVPFYHFLIDFIPLVDLYLKANDLSYKDLVIVIPPYKNRGVVDFSMDTLYDFYVEEIQNRGATCIEIPSPETSRTRVIVPSNNFYTIEDGQPDLGYVHTLRNFLLESINYTPKGNLEKPNIIYLSREKTWDTFEIPPSTLRGLKNSSYVDFPPRYPRIDNENAFIQYLTNRHKISPICPEDFKTFKEQLEFFTTVDVLISATSSGLLNMIVMPVNSTIVELRTPMIGFVDFNDYSSELRQDYHDHYSLLSATIGIHYISIDNKDRHWLHLIDKLEKTYWADSLLSGIVQSDNQIRA